VRIALHAAARLLPVVDPPKLIRRGVERSDLIRRLAIPTREGFVRRWSEPRQVAVFVGKVDGMLNSIGISLLLGAPWIVAIIWTWSRAPRSDAAWPSMADRARNRLWA